MKKFEEIPKEKVKMAFYITEYIEELNYVLEKIDMLVYDLSENYLERINFKTEKGRLTAEYDIKIARVKADVMRDYMQQTSIVQNELTKLAKANFEMVKEENKQT